MGALARALPAVGRRASSARRNGGGNRARNALVAIVLLAGALAAGYMLWLRDSSLVAIERVVLSGVEDRPDLAAALEREARNHTTLNLDREALNRAVAGDPAVRSVAAVPDFPRGVAIEVELREPVGQLATGAIVAGDGTILGGEGVSRGELPAIDVRGAGGSPGTAIDGDALLLARVLAGAPGPLLGVAEAAEIDPELGPVVTVEPGVELRFGERSRAADKWRAAAAVLADRRLDEVAYLDLSVPERPVAGAPRAEPE